jgi:hypothetical protein
MFIPILPSFPLSDVLPFSTTGIFDGEYWKSEPDERVYLFSRGKWALQAMAESCLEKEITSKRILFFPEYFCESSLEPLRSLGYGLHFYRIMDNMEPDISHLYDLVKQTGPPSILVFVHYFGIPLNLEPVSLFCKDWGIILIEDGAHSLGPVPGIGGQGHPVIYTPWKFIPSLEGALLVVPNGMEKIAWNVPERRRVWGYPWKWIAKRVLYDFLVWSRFPVHKVKNYAPREYSSGTNYGESTEPLCRSFFQNLLQTSSRRFDFIAKRREDNFFTLDKMICEASMEDFSLIRKKPSSFAPYLYALRLPGKISWKLMTSLARDGIPALPWSELSPEVIHSTEYQGARLMEKEIVTLPVHHSLTEKNMVWMGKRLIKKIRELL